MNRIADSTHKNRNSTKISTEIVYAKTAIEPHRIEVLNNNRTAEQQF
jgi:hypothetical protein